MCSSRPTQFFAAVTALAAVFAGSSAHGRDHYCGMYAAYSLLDHYQKAVPFESLLQPEYVSSFQGSTAEEIVRALDDHGVAAQHYAGLGVFDLRMAVAPMVLHVRGNQGTRQYQHWVVYLGEQQGKAVILDPSSGQSRVDFGRVLALWDGIAVASAASSHELHVWRGLCVLARWAMLIVLGGALVPVVRFIDDWQPWKSRRAKAGQPLLRTGVFLVFCTIASVGIDSVNRSGFLRSSVARGAIASVHGSLRVPEIGFAEALLLHSKGFQDPGAPKGSPVWIDARFSRDFEVGHIAGAISLPIDATFGEEDAVVASLPPDAQAIVYCQSEGCGFADAVAVRLRGHGLTSVRLFRPGYREWQASGAAIARSDEAIRDGRPEDATAKSSGERADQ